MVTGGLAGVGLIDTTSNARDAGGGACACANAVARMTSTLSEIHNIVLIADDSFALIPDP